MQHHRRVSARQLALLQVLCFGMSGLGVAVVRKRAMLAMISFYQITSYVTYDILMWHLYFRFGMSVCLSVCLVWSGSGSGSGSGSWSWSWSCPCPGPVPVLSCPVLSCLSVCLSVCLSKRQHVSLLLHAVRVTVVKSNTSVIFPKFPWHSPKRIVIVVRITHIYTYMYIYIYAICPLFRVFTWC